MGLVLHLCVILIVASVGCKGTTENYCFALLDRYTNLYMIFVAKYLMLTKVIVIGSYRGRVVKNSTNPRDGDVHGCEVADASYHLAASGQKGSPPLTCLCLLVWQLIALCNIELHFEQQCWYLQN